MADNSLTIAVSPQFLVLTDLLVQIKAQKEEYELVQVGQPSIGSIMAQHNGRIYAHMEKMAELLLSQERRIEDLERKLRTPDVLDSSPNGEVHTDRTPASSD